VIQRLLSFTVLLRPSSARVMGKPEIVPGPKSASRKLTRSVQIVGKPYLTGSGKGSP
jgi:hypothetical protein